MIKIKVFKSDKLYDIDFTLKDANSTVVDITGATLKFKAQKHEATALKFTGSMTIISGTAGTCRYNVAETDFDEVGNYYAEVEVTFGSGKVVTFGNIVVVVEPELPR